MRPLDEGGVGAARPDVAVLAGPSPGRRSMTLRDRAGVFCTGGTGDVGAVAGGGALACPVFAANKLAEMRCAKSCTMAFIFVAFRFSYAVW